MKTLFGLELTEAEDLARELGAAAYRGRQLAEWLYHKQITDLKEARNLPGEFLEKLGESFRVRALSPAETSRSENGESTKYLFRTEDNRLLETVLISQKNRQTVCVSTQLGCKIGCTFCASGKGPFGRNLTAGEILEQIAWVQASLGEPVTNVVYMGMGEPLDNFDETMKSLRILQAPWGFGMGSRRITVSTSGLIPQIREFVRRSEGRVRLSVSLHAAENSRRNELVPVNRKYPLEELMRALGEINHRLKRDITFEYTLIGGINDSKIDAYSVARLANSLKAKLNLIPYNPIAEMDYERPGEEQVALFAKILEDRGVPVTVRKTAGRDIHAACGQLRLDREKATGN